MRSACGIIGVLSMCSARLARSLVVANPTRSFGTTTVVSPDKLATLNSLEFEPSASTSVPVIILHGLLGNSRNFQSWGRALSNKLEKPRKIIALDCRNHGSSSHLDSMSYGDMAADLENFLKQRGIAKAILVGHSMGGKTAALTTLLRPELVQGLVVMDIAPVSYAVVDQSSWGETQKVISAIHNLDLSKVADRREADAALATNIVDPSLRAFAVSNLETAPDGGLRWRVNVEAVYRAMPSLAQFRYNGREVADLGMSYSGDVLFLAGGRSRYVRSGHLEAMRRLFPRNTLRTVRDAGHWIHADAPQETVEIIKNFLDRDELP